MNDGMNVSGPSNDEYETPPWLFKALDAEFRFTMDGAANEKNHLLRRYLCEKGVMEGGLLQQDNVTSDYGKRYWKGERVYCNPPYSKIGDFIWLAKYADLAVLLLPVRTDSDWFHDLIDKRITVRWFRKRIRFLLNGKEADSPRFASMLAIFNA